MLKAGIIGLPNVGKSTLFNAITKQSVVAENYPFATIEPNVGIVLVNDKRQEILKDIYETDKVIKAAYEFTDIAGLVKGASKGEGLGNKFLSHIREVDAIVHVVRCFDNSNITHVEGDVNPVRDIDIINLELILSDLEVVVNRISKIENKIKNTKEAEEEFEYYTLIKCKNNLEKDIPLRYIEFTKEEKLIIKNFNFITLKKVLYIGNVNEEDINDGNKYTEKLIEYAKKENSKIIISSLEMEKELMDLNEEEKKAFLNDLEIEKSGLDSLIEETYSLLGLKTYFTCGKVEVRAWTFTEGMDIKSCAGIIHTDFEKGFIRAEVISYEDLIEHGNELKAREAGKMRLEGKDYITRDGDICHFRFNV